MEANVAATPTPPPAEKPSFAALQKVFHLPLVDAAGALGISPTGLKRWSRRLGVPRWPFRKVWRGGEGGTAMLNRSGC